ncbi:DUF1800 domain-containing protein [Phytohabitans suffuscus]|uniref:DUF1800 domain-containing protein n=1 Tax=Phytohabitans suffuscus TaxID=624315 RepID=A0A6F8YDB7_9ACTN|nr:DUF1800 domain-containing protein [Phytohabitans suffuscus]BCB84096.1 hypothetical protein Psuf_014090 [Phytohabitans suffuscus]
MVDRSVPRHAQHAEPAVQQEPHSRHAEPAVQQEPHSRHAEPAVRQEPHTEPAVRQEPLAVQAKPHSHHYRPYVPPPPKHRASEHPTRQPPAPEPAPQPEEPPRRRRARGVGRRKAILGISGLAALTGGTAFAATPSGQDVVDWALGRTDYDPAADAASDGNPGRPGGQQPSTVRTYTEQNESYMASKAGDALRGNIPAGGRRFSSPAIAAQATKVTVPTALTNDPIRHLASRLTFGPTQRVMADIARVGIDDWIAQQLDPERIALTPDEAKLGELTTLGMSVADLRAARKDLEAKGVRADEEMVQATIARQIWSDRQLFEVMVDFWNDFLHVPAFHEGSAVLRSSFDRDVIRRYALDNYPDMLVAANRHPALLTYLDQPASTKDEVTDNLARENLELYSVGVDGGYTERDVRQAALLQTGRTVKDDQYVYRADKHYAGPVKIMGFSHPNTTPEGGERAGEEYFRYLASHPSTARRIAARLATRFVSDTPPPALVERLARSYTVNRGAVKPVLLELLSSSEFWAAVGQKVRRPLEYVVATYRTLGVSPQTPASFRAATPGRTPFAEGMRQLQERLRELGHFPAGAPGPTGYPDVFVAWTSASTMVGLWNEAADAVAGSRPMFTYQRPEQLVGANPPKNALGYVAALAQRLVHQPLDRDDLTAVAGAGGLAPGAAVDANLNGAVVAVARVILASPQHLLR